MFFSKRRLSYFWCDVLIPSHFRGISHNAAHFGGGARAIRVNTCSFHQGQHDLTQHLWTTPSGKVQVQVTSIASNSDNWPCCLLVIAPFLCFFFVFLNPLPFFPFSLFFEMRSPFHTWPWSCDLVVLPGAPRIAVALDVTLAACDCVSSSFSVDGNPKPANRNSSTIVLRRGLSSLLVFSTQEGGGGRVLSVWVCTA